MAGMGQGDRGQVRNERLPVGALGDEDGEVAELALAHYRPRLV